MRQIGKAFSGNGSCMKYLRLLRQLVNGQNKRGTCMYLALQMCLQPIYAVLRAYMKRYTYVQLSLFGESSSSREEKGKKGKGEVQQ